MAARAANIISLLTLEEKAAPLEAGAPAVARIALPAYSYARECERGDSSGLRGTAFPSGAGLAASWDAGLVFRVAQLTALEARANGNAGDGSPSCFGPVVNFIHDATWGRTNEMLTGEDTTLGAALGAAFVAGLQSWREATPAGERLAVASTVKHLNAYSGPEGHGFTFGPYAERFSFNASMSQRAWREFFVPAFRATARAGARAFMCSYTAVTTDDGFLDNTPACASAQLLTRVLREEFNWGGYVISDAGGVVFSGNTSIGGVPFGHHQTGDAASTAVASLTAGCDVELTCCGAPAVFQTLPASVGAGLVPEAALDAALARALTSRLELGVLDPPHTHSWDAWGAANVSTPEMVALAGEAAAAGVVLLKNAAAPGAAAPLLPLSPADLAGAAVAVVGPLANDSWAVMGGYVNQHPAFIRTVYDGFVDALPLSNVLLDAACASSACPAYNASAVALAARADVALVVAVLGTTGYFDKGANNESAACGCPLGNAIEGECCDRTDTRLPGAQLALLQALAALGKPLLLVLNSGGYVDAGWPAASAAVAAIVHAPFLGMAAGDGVARVATGAANPSAKTTLTWWEDAARDLAPLSDYTDAALYAKTYRYGTAPVTFPFGHGLSYASFSFGDLDIAPPQPRGCDTLNVSVTLSNNADIDGAEVVQVYGALRNATVRAPRTSVRRACTSKLASL
jgi:beta-glucosidase